MTQNSDYSSRPRSCGIFSMETSLSTQAQLGLSLTLASCSPGCPFINHVFSYTTLFYFVSFFWSPPTRDYWNSSQGTEQQTRGFTDLTCTVLTIHGHPRRSTTCGHLRCGWRTNWKAFCRLTCRCLSVSQGEHLGDPQPLLPTLIDPSLWWCRCFPQLYSNPSVKPAGPVQTPTSPGRLPRSVTLPSPAMTKVPPLNSHRTALVPWGASFSHVFIHLFNTYLLSTCYKGLFWARGI